MYQSILVPFDGSSFAEEALRLANYLGNDSEATIYLLGVTELLPAGDELGRLAVGVSPMEPDREGLEKVVREELEQAWAKLDNPKAHPEFIVSWGQPARAIVSEAEKNAVEVIVMGSRGLSNLQALAVGSVSHKVMHVAPCRVITIH
ncbi:universal stress protein [Salinisphaera sp. SPP-AMP-43]|uniref:universal stress protein n=1 Tax=Salinisphaera sp. SPP-AMP-43 TaxID=3121288 RepID=UPI003C6E6D06